jgi:integrase
MSKTGQGPRLKRNERGVYEIHWSDNGRSKRSSTRTSDLQSAQKVLAAFLMLGGREQRLAANDRLLVMDVIGDPDAPDGKDYWHEHVVPNVISKETAEFAIKKLRQHFGRLVVADIMPSDVDDYVEARRAGRIGKPSINHTITRELAFLNAAINHAVKKKRLARAEAPFIQTPGKSPPRDRWLTFEEAERLISAAGERIDPHQPKDRPPRVLRFALLALETASRRTAVLELRRGQVDLKQGLIYLNPKGRRQTNKRRPTVPISRRLRPILEQTLEAIPDDPNAPLLDHTGCIRTSFENCVARAKLGRDVTPHVLRHTKATWMAQAGRDMFEIAGLLGDTVATVTTTYAHHHPDYLRDAVEVGPGAPRLKVVGGTA